MRRASSSNEADATARNAKALLAKVQVSPPYFWDFGVYERIFGRNAETVVSPSTPRGADAMRSITQKSSSEDTNGIGPTKRVAWSSSFREEDLVPYTIAFGDTFDSIALKHDMTAVELRRANTGVMFSSQAVPGQELRVKKISAEKSSGAIASEGETKNGGVDNNRESLNDSKMQSEGVERPALLCLGTSVRVPGRLIIGITSGFLLFEPAEFDPVTTPTKMIFALDRRDILGCAAVSRIASRIKGDEDESSMLLQIVWKNTELGFPSDQQIFFEVGGSDIIVLVDAVYLSEPSGTASSKSTPVRRTLTSGIPALRVIDEMTKSFLVEDFVSSNTSLSINMNDSIDEDEINQVTMMPHESQLISQESALALANMLPDRLKHCSWQLLYDFCENGVSFFALMAAARAHSETLLLVRSLETREVVGAYVVEPWEVSGKNGFFGTGETFVFKVGSANQVEKFSWSGANDFFQTCSTTHLGVGGGGNFAFCLDADLLNCTSGRCLTFAGLENRSLASQQSFTIDGIELWGFERFSRGKSSTLGSLADEGPLARAQLKSPRSGPTTPSILHSIDEQATSTSNKTNKDLPSGPTLSKRTTTETDEEYVKL